MSGVKQFIINSGEDDRKPAKKRSWDYTNIDKCPIFVQKAKRLRGSYDLTPSRRGMISEDNGMNEESNCEGHLISKIVDHVISDPRKVKMGKSKSSGLRTHANNIAPAAFANIRIQRARQRQLEILENANKKSKNMSHHLQDLYQKQSLLTKKLLLSETVDHVVEKEVGTSSTTLPTLTQSEGQDLIRDWVEYERASYLRYFKNEDGSQMFKPPPIPECLKWRGYRPDICQFERGCIDLLVLKFFFGGLKNPLAYALKCGDCCINSYYVARAKGLYPEIIGGGVGSLPIPIKTFNPWTCLNPRNNWHFNSAMFYGLEFQKLTQSAFYHVIKLEELYTSPQSINPCSNDPLNKYNYNNNNNNNNNNVLELSVDKISNRLSYFIVFFFLNPFHLLVESGRVSPYPHLVLELNRRSFYMSKITREGWQAHSNLNYGIRSTRKMEHMFEAKGIGLNFPESVQNHFSVNFSALKDALDMSCELNLLLKCYQTNSMMSEKGDISHNFLPRQEKYLSITEFLNNFVKMNRSDAVAIAKWLTIPATFHEHYSFDVLGAHQCLSQENSLVYRQVSQLRCHKCKDNTNVRPLNPWIPINPSRDKFLLKTVSKFVTTTRNRKSVSAPLNKGINELKRKSSQTREAVVNTEEEKRQKNNSVEYMQEEILGAKDEESSMVIQATYSDRLSILWSVTQSLMTTYYSQVKALTLEKYEGVTSPFTHVGEKGKRTFNETHVACHTEMKKIGEALSLAFLKVAIIFSGLLSESEYDILLRLAGVGGYRNSFHEYWENLQVEYTNLNFQYKGMNNNRYGYSKEDITLSQSYSHYIPIYHLSDYPTSLDTHHQSDLNLSNSIFIS